MVEKKINIAYKEVLVYDENGAIYYPNSNLANYDIHPDYTAKCGKLHEVEEELNIKFPYYMTNQEDMDFRGVLGQFNSQKFEGYFDDTFGIFDLYTLDDAIEKDINFIFPIVLFTMDLYEDRESTVEFDEKLVKRVKAKKAKICFIQLTEGFFGKKEEDFVWLSRLSDRYGFDKDHIIFITANLKAQQSKEKLTAKKLIKDNFTIIQYNYFQHNLWFYNYGKMLDSAAIEKLKAKFDECLMNNKLNKKTNHFLCFNRVPKLHRMVVFAELKTNPAFTDKYITSLGASLDNIEDDFLVEVNEYLDDSYRHGKKRLINFYKNYDCRKPTIYDEPDLENNKATTLNLTAHNNSFVNIVTESLIEPEFIFFSEKTFKPIFCAQPFIMIGNPHSLKKLKEIGFQTFDKWWDESYDEEKDFTKRMAKIVDVMTEISTWDVEKRYKITNEMESVLINNFNVMISTDEIYDLYKKIEF